MMIQDTTETIARQVAASLLEVGAIRLRPSDPFTWSSGWKSPIYCDNRLALSYPAVRTYIKNALAERIRQTFPGVEAIAGVATAGIPQGALVADVLELPFLYVRSKPKEHGMGNMIEGKVSEGQKVVVIEDLISTGGSSLKVVDALREAGAEVLGMAAIFTYGFAVAKENFAEKNVELLTLSDYAYLLTEASNLNIITEADKISLASWRQSPDTWGK
ncbi:orotate phosphoribosyltransferase [Cytophagaceae bacterium YF14B1]|uniref:Orotate phosphoribosyltransferase n=1 Tax=Xanthocytophaga flava TaxID=3048013 RepID=A0AAE3QLI3_9BACT|nr:orotate phosphoribosyltransferase [Xanthocytophaga flavus]MDJ1472583.1 orotate phosphoribosyltransferase [Xanthocytophaga flavus]MDJ1481140.1 orotate phosphoribosyltransferase [Xanthocytophaga flavus]